MRRATGGWNTRGSNDELVASDSPDVQSTSIERDSADEVHLNARRYAPCGDPTSGLPTIRELTLLSTLCRLPRPWDTRRELGTDAGCTGGVGMATKLGAVCLAGRGTVYAGSPWVCGRKLDAV
jgi:hypothetical protein